MKSVRPELPKIAEIYDYLTAPAEGLPDQAEVAFVFGRKSGELIDATAEAVQVADYTVISGNVGKDSGDLPKTATAESAYLVNGVRRKGVDTDHIFTETRALDGIEATKYSIEIIEKDLCLESVGKLVVVMHPTQTRRLGATLAKQAERDGLRVDKLVHYPTKYPFDVSNIYDQNEAAAELARIEAYSAGRNPIIDRPEDLPAELVEYAVALEAHFKELFKMFNIRNSSTAEDTDRAKSPVQTILFNTDPNKAMPARAGDYSMNFLRLARAAARQKLAPNLPF